MRGEGGGEGRDDCWWAGLGELGQDEERERARAGLGVGCERGQEEGDLLLGERGATGDGSEQLG